MNEDDILEIDECSPFSPDESITQGTIIKFEDKPADETYGIIVTADCDIAQNKYGKYLSFCYMFPLNIYVNDYLIPKLCVKKVNRLKQQLYDEIRQLPNLTKISESAFQDLISYKETELEKLIPCANLIQKIINNRSNFKKEFFSLSDYKNLVSKNSKDLVDAIRNFPGDKFYINCIPNINNNGFVVNLRRIAEIEVATIQKRYFNSDFKCFAFAKLNSPYKQKMAQMLGAMFSDIGLSSAFENTRNKVIENFVKEIIK